MCGLPPLTVVGSGGFPNCCGGCVCFARCRVPPSPLTVSWRSCPVDAGRATTADGFVRWVPLFRLMGAVLRGCLLRCFRHCSGMSVSQGSLISAVERLQCELRDVEARLGDPAVQSDVSQLAVLGRRFKQLEGVVSAGLRWRAACEDLEVAIGMLRDSQGADRAGMRAEVAALEALVDERLGQVRVLMLPPDLDDGRNVIVEVRGAVGGEEANLFARDLLVMYEAFAKRMRWRMELLSSSPTVLGGVSEAALLLSGDSVWSRMRLEAGTHRVQRVPVTESQGRVHTSSATVIVLPEPEEVEVRVDANDLRVDTYRSSGNGGQHANVTDSAVRVTHLPTGLVVHCQNERRQHLNKDRAVRVLRARLRRLEQDRVVSELSALRRGQVSSGGRSEKIRTYNFKENRLTDHRIGFTVHKLDRVLAGELDEVSDALLTDERQQQLCDHV